MKKICLIILVISTMLMFSACQNASDSVEMGTPSASSTDIAEMGNASEKQGKSTSEDDWDGEWSGGDVSVKIRLADSYVKFNDADMHNADADEISVDGNTLTAVYRVTLEMYADPDAGDMPEQTWTITMVKNGDTISYSRTAELEWFSLNDDGTYGHTVVKENSQTLTRDK